MNCKPRVAAAAVTLALGLLTTIAAGEPDAGMKADLARLGELETKISAGVLEQAGPRKDLRAYLIDGNPKLFERGKAVLASGGRSMTVVVGPAGLGKSGLLAELATTAKADTVTLKVRSIAEKMGDSVTMEPDLASADGATVFNKLPRAKDGADLSLTALCKALADKEQPPTLVLFDDVDEVHADTARQILANVWKFVNVKEADGKACHVFCFGRAEAFVGFFNDPANAGAQAGVEVIEARSVEAYNDPTYLEVLTESLFAGRAAPPAAAPADPAKPDAPKPEDAAEKPDPAKAAAAKTLAFLKRQPALVRTAQVRSNGNNLIDAINATPAVAIKSHVLNAMLGRAGGTHGRPTTNTPELFENYVRALEDVAAKYAKVDDEGYFTPAAEDTVAVAPKAPGGAPMTLRVRTLLDRSGLIVIDGVKTGKPRYRFEPFWLHRYLAERQANRGAEAKPAEAKP